MAKQSEPEVVCPVCQFMSWAKDAKATKHLRNARREVLLAVKAAVEAGIERLDKEEAPRTKGRAKKVKIG